MKAIKYIVIGLLVLIGLTIGSQLVLALGGFIFAGFVILAGLDAIGLIKAPNDDKTVLILSVVIGVLLAAAYYGITGLPE